MDKKQTLEVIDEVVEADRKIAREAIATGVRQAQDQWIESTLIAEALALEIIKVSRSSLSESAIAAHLRAIAISLESEKSLH
jgi:hypothetical protein|tara:strand:+ start:222 stop:467 length:246 start_codon:yes stop_codon:yes gene_type:complete